MQDGMCNTFWGGHGCDLDKGHDGAHRCGDVGDECSEARGSFDNAEVRYMCYGFPLPDDDPCSPGVPVGWSEWMPGTLFS